MIHLNCYNLCLGVLLMGQCINVAVLEVEAETGLGMQEVDCEVMPMKNKGAERRTARVRPSESSASLLSVKGKYRASKIGQKAPDHEVNLTVLVCPTENLEAKLPTRRAPHCTEMARPQDEHYAQSLAGGFLGST